MKYIPLALIMVLLLTCGCATKGSRSGRSTFTAGIPGVGTLEGGSNAPPGANVGSSFYAEKIEITGTASEIFAVIVAGGNITDLLNLKEKTEKPQIPAELP